jgi:hypothetical protein
MLFVPSYVREKWREKKEAIRAASLDVRAVATQVLARLEHSTSGTSSLYH